jgi:glycosyltransferase involved in cell wall biosynthesis
MLISVCIPSVRYDTVAAAVRGVLAQTYGDWELVVVGQGADTRVGDRVADAAGRDRRVRYVHVPELGASRARNVAVEEARGDVFAFTDDDCVPARNWLAVVAERMAADRRVGVVGGAVLAPLPDRAGPASCPTNSPTESVYDPFASDFAHPEGWDWLTANVAIRRSAAEQVGRFDECLGPGTEFPAAEDPDYKMRLERLGVRMRVTPSSVVVHQYGHRYGYGALYRHMRNYAEGNGALAAKLEMMGDPRARQRLTELRRAILVDPPRAVVNALRLAFALSAYRRCHAGYVLDATGHYLLPRGTRRSAEARVPRDTTGPRGDHTGGALPRRVAPAVSAGRS